MLTILGNFEFLETQKTEDTENSSVIAYYQNTVAPFEVNKKAGAYKLTFYDNYEVKSYALGNISSIQNDTIFGIASGKTFGYTLKQKEGGKAYYEFSITLGSKQYLKCYTTQYLTPKLEKLVNKHGSNFADIISVIGYYTSREYQGRLYHSLSVTDFDILKWTAKETRITEAISAPSTWATPSTDWATNEISTTWSSDLDIVF